MLTRAVAFPPLQLADVMMGKRNFYIGLYRDGKKIVKSLSFFDNGKLLLVSKSKELTPYKRGSAKIAPFSKLSTSSSR